MKAMLTDMPRLMPKSATEIAKRNVFNVRSGGYVNYAHALKTESAHTCSILGLNGGKNNNCLLHIAPEHQSLVTLESDLTKCVGKIREKMANAQEKVKGLLIGGIELDKKDKESVASFDLYTSIANVLDKLDVPFSMICGKAKDAPHDNMFVVGDTLTAWNEDFKDLKLPKNATQDEIADALSTRYQFVELSPEVPISTDL